MGLVVCGPRLENVLPPCQNCILECAKTREGGQGSIALSLLFRAFGFLEPDLHNAARTAVAVADLLSKGASSIALAGFPQPHLHRGRGPRERVPVERGTLPGIRSRISGAPSVALCSLLGPHEYITLNQGLGLGLTPANRFLARTECVQGPANE